MKPRKATLLVTGEDAVNINIGLPMGFHIPFWSLPNYYDGGIHRPLAKVGDPNNNKSAGHELFPITGMFANPNTPPGGDLPPDSWITEGVWIGKEKYDPRDILGAHLRVDHDQEIIFTSVQSVNMNRPFPAPLRNFTEMTTFRPPIVAEHTVARFHQWRAKIEANLPHMKNSWGDADIPENIIYAGSGPSLRKNYMHLNARNPHTTSLWACNEAFSWLLKHGVCSDYFFCIDAQSPAHWWDCDCSNTCLVTTSFVNPEILKTNWKQVYWFNIGSDGFYYNLVRKHHPHLAEIDATMGVGSAMIESAWMKKAKQVILTGCDFCYHLNPETKTMLRSVGSELTPQDWKKLSVTHPHYIAIDSTGKAVPTFMGLALEACMVYGAAQCLWEKGVKVINATEGGILRPNPLARYLWGLINKKNSRPCENKTLQEALT